MHSRVDQMSEGGIYFVYSDMSLNCQVPELNLPLLPVPVCFNFYFSTTADIRCYFTLISGVQHGGRLSTQSYFHSFVLPGACMH